MSESFKSPSLAQHFEAPDNFRGRFGWLCGYSADADFLNDAAERFTRQTQRQRAYEGRIALALMLDPGNPPVRLDETPAVMHLPIKDSNNKPFVLLHAKVAILGFRHESETSRWHLRLIVSTGNWTCETLEKSLDLAWRIDISSEDVNNITDPLRQHCSDIRSAWNLLSWLGNYYDLRALNPLLPGKVDSESDNARKTVMSWIEATSLIAGQTQPRFIDNRKASLFKQLPEMIKLVGSAVRRNYLGMGSGFFENSSDDSVPSVLKDIVDSLKENQLLTANPEIDVFVNPLSCQAVANSLKALSKAGFTVRPAGQPTDLFVNPLLKRSLHAKFIFSANYRENSNYCNSSWLYLGSGNLTGPGFSNKMSVNGENLEAGVIFAPDNLYWGRNKDLAPEQLIFNLLPVQWETDATTLTTPLSAGAEMPERAIQFTAPPVAWMLWLQTDGLSYLKSPGGEKESFEVIDTNEQVCTSDSEGKFLWMFGRPRFATLRWNLNGKPQISAVPVLDEYGRLAATELPQIDLDEAWWQLANFPIPPEDEELLPKDDLPADNPTDPPDPNGAASSSSEANYPIRTMMELIENIAAKQTSVSRDDWTAWCTRLEQSLIQAKNSPVIKSFEALGINSLSPLWEMPFRPVFAENDKTDEGLRYEAVLQRVESAWNFTSLSKIGGNNELAI